MINSLFRKIENKNGKYYKLLAQKNLEYPKKIVKKVINNKTAFAKPMDLFLLSKFCSNVRLIESKSEAIVKTTPIELCFYNYSQVYLQFLCCINTTNDSKTSIKRFEIVIFSTIFSNEFNDSVINLFIKKLVDDPVFYENEQKKYFFEVLKFAFLYCYRLKKTIFLKSVKDKLMKLQALQGTVDSDFVHIICDDPFIDTLSLKSKEHTDKYSEGIFLNSYYKKHILNKKNEQMTEIFLARIHRNLVKLEPKHHVSFLKIIFLHNSVLSNVLSDVELIKIHFGLFKILKIAKETSCAILFNTANTLHKTCSYKIITSVLDEIQSLNISSTKQKKNLIEVDLYSKTTIDEILEFVEQQKDKPVELNACLKKLFPILQKIGIYDISHTNLHKTLTFCFFLVQNIKKNCLIDFLLSFVSVFKVLFEKVLVEMRKREAADRICGCINDNGETSVGNTTHYAYDEKESVSFDYRLFCNEEKWTQISDFILLIQKSEFKNTQHKKKKTKTSFSTSKNLLLKKNEALIKILREIEGLCKKISNNTPTLKLRGIKSITFNNN